MDMKTIWIDSVVPLRKPQKNFFNVRLPIAVSISCVSADDAERMADVTLVTKEFTNPESTFRVMRHGGALWRPMIVRQDYWRETEIRGEEAISSLSSDNPLARVSNRHHRQIETAKPGERSDADPGALADLETALAEAARDVCLIDGMAHRTCHEPTWIVAKSRFGPRGIIVQPFLGVPGRSMDAAWFTSDRLDAAVAFATELAAELGIETEEPRGAIVRAPGFDPSFDDVAFAENRVLQVFTKDIVNLSGSLPEDILEMAAEARSLRNTDRSSAVETALRIESLLSVGEYGPDVDALLSAGHFAASQSRYFQRNAILSDEDEEALKALTFSR